MAASKQTSWLSVQFDLVQMQLNIHLGTLADGLVCLPLVPGPWRPETHSQSYVVAFGVCQGSVGDEAP